MPPSRRAGGRRLVARDRRRARGGAAAGPAGQGPDAGAADGPGAPLLRHVLWAPGVYLVPRDDGRLMIGAHGRGEAVSIPILTAGGVLGAARGRMARLPTIEELPIDEMWVGFRPGSRDDAPILGPTPVEGWCVATGHHRNGILLAPITAARSAAIC